SWPSRSSRSSRSVTARATIATFWIASTAASESCSPARPSAPSSCFASASCRIARTWSACRWLSRIFVLRLETDDFTTEGTEETDPLRPLRALCGRSTRLYDHDAALELRHQFVLAKDQIERLIPRHVVKLDRHGRFDVGIDGHADVGQFRKDVKD